METFYFVVSCRRHDGHTIISPLSFPKEEAERRARYIRRSYAWKGWTAIHFAAPDDHPRWTKALFGLPLEEHYAFVQKGMGILERNNHYGLL